MIVAIDACLTSLSGCDGLPVTLVEEWPWPGARSGEGWALFANKPGQNMENDAFFHNVSLTVHPQERSIAPSGTRHGVRTGVPFVT